MSAKIDAQSMIMQRRAENKTIIATGLALFAMFFGAGNIVFPLHLGAHSGQNIAISIFGFLISAVGVPFFGVMATSLYDGDYHAFFERLGKIPAFIIIVFLLFILGPLGAMPRTETTTYNTLLPYLPEFLQNNALFSIIYCALVLVFAFRETKVVNILGLFFSPIKIISFSCLILMGVLIGKGPIDSLLSSKEAFTHAFTTGYNTMDLVAAFFFCTAAFRSVKLSSLENNGSSPIMLNLKASALGAIVISLVYAGFMFVAYSHAHALIGMPAEQTISAVAFEVLGKFGGLFVCIAVSFACFATALALAEVSSHCLHHQIFRRKISKPICLMMVMLLTYLMSNLGFQGLAKVIGPVVTIIYPALIVLCLMNILYKWKGIQMVKLPVFLTLLVTIVGTLF